MLAVCLLFVEREENVKADIFHAYITLLKQTKPSSIQDPDSMELEEGYVFSTCMLINSDFTLVAI